MPPWRSTSPGAPASSTTAPHSSFAMTAPNSQASCFSSLTDPPGVTRGPMVPSRTSRMLPAKCADYSWRSELQTMLLPTLFLSRLRLGVTAETSSSIPPNCSTLHSSPATASKHFATYSTTVTCSFHQRPSLQALDEKLP